MINLTGSGSVMTGASKDVSLMKLKKACTEFESVFITYMLKTQETIPAENGFLGKNKIIQSMFSENVARGIAGGGGMGLGDMLFERVSGEL